MSLKQHHGKACPYCGRAMERRHPRLAPTRDHVVPESKGGRVKIIACLQCNGIKADMPPELWAAFMAANPGWWTLSLRELRIRKRAGFNTPGHKAPLKPARRERPPYPIDAPQPVLAPPIAVGKGWHKRVVVPPELIWMDEKLRATADAEEPPRSPPASSA